LILENWPERGEVKYQNVSLIYNDSKQSILRNINFTIKPNEKIGIVGRSGVGKSSLISTLFRLYKFQEIISSLDFKIVKNDENFSTGQKQLICLARAMASQNKIVVLDEATANLDSKNDALLQDIVKKHFACSTVLMIAHKLQSIVNCDKVMVLDKNEIIEYGKPTDLLKNEKGSFYK
ncbi:ABC tran, MMR HSR1, and/or SbcCD C domain containing protein, partial [Asbolus verrucosus]